MISQIDTLFENCEQLPERTEKTVIQLDYLIFRRANLRDFHPNPSVEKEEICLISEGTWQCYLDRLTLEWATSFSLGHVQTHYKDIQQTVQVTLEIHERLLESAAYEGKPGDRERADAAVLSLEKKTASFNSIVRRLLHTIYLTDSEAWEYVSNLSPALQNTVHELQERLAHRNQQTRQYFH